MNRAPVYLDYAATTPVDARVAARMAECLTIDGAFGNPSSLHVYGRDARVRVEQARSAVAALIGASAPQIVWTSGATESNNLAILGTLRARILSKTASVAKSSAPARHVVTVRSEHKSVLDPCKVLEREGCAVTYLTPDAEGLIDIEALRAALRPETQLVSIMHANNEIGVVQDIQAIGLLCRERGIALHVDAAQSVGKLMIDVSRWAVDFLSITAHKFYGPKGIGALYVAPTRRGLIVPLLHGGGHERGLRSGTLATHQIVGFGAAAELAVAERAVDMARIEQLRARLWAGLATLDGVLLNGHPTRRVANILNVSFQGIEGESLLLGLPEIAVSTGSACNSDSDEPSYVLRALGRSSELAHSSLRFSLGRFTTADEIDAALSAVSREVRRLRAVAQAGAGAFVVVPPLTATPSSAAVDERSAANDALTPATQAIFTSLAHAGDLQEAANVLRGEAGREQLGTRVRFAVAVVDGRIAAVRFQAYGCPHTLAVCEWLSAQLEGQSICDISLGKPIDWACKLDVPENKLGRLLLIEDALQAVLHSLTESGVR